MKKRNEINLIEWGLVIDGLVMILITFIACLVLFGNKSSFALGLLTLVIGGIGLFLILFRVFKFYDYKNISKGPKIILIICTIILFLMMFVLAFLGWDRLF